MGFDWLRKRATESENEETGTFGTSGTSGAVYTAPKLPFMNPDPYKKPAQNTETKPWQPKTDEDFKNAAMALANRRGEAGKMLGIAAREEWMNKKYKERKDAGEKDVPKDVVPYHKTVTDYQFTNELNAWYKARKDSGEEGVPDYIGDYGKQEYTDNERNIITEDEFNKINATNAIIDKYNNLVEKQKNGEMNYLDFYLTRKTLWDAGVEIEKGDGVFENALDGAYRKTLREIMLSDPDLYYAQNELYKKKFEAQFNRNLNILFEKLSENEIEKANREAERVKQIVNEKDKNKMVAMGLDPFSTDDVKKYRESVLNPTTKEEHMEERMQEQDKKMGPASQKVDKWLKPSKNADYELHYSDNSGIPDKIRIEGAVYTQAYYNKYGPESPGAQIFYNATHPGENGENLTWDKVGQKTEVDNTPYTQGSSTNPKVTKTFAEYAKSVSGGIKVSPSDRNGMSVRMVKSELEDQAQAEAQEKADKFNQDKNAWIKEKMGADYEKALSGMLPFSHKTKDGKTYTEKDYLAFGGSELPGYDQFISYVKSKGAALPTIAHGATSTAEIKTFHDKMNQCIAYDRFAYYLELSAQFYQSYDPTKTVAIDMSGVFAEYEKAKAIVKGGDHSPTALKQLETSKAYCDLGNALNDYNTLNKKNPAKLAQLQNEGATKSTFDDRFMTNEEYAEYTYLVGLYGDEEDSLARFYIDSISEKLKERAKERNTNVSSVRRYDRKQREISDLYINDCESSADRAVYIAEGKSKFIGASKSELKNGDSFDNDVYYTKNLLSDFANKTGDERREIYGVLDQISELYGNENAGDTLFYILGKYGFEEASKYSETLNSFYLKAKGIKTAEKYEKAGEFKRGAMGTGFGLSDWGKGIVSLVNFFNSGEENLPVIFSNDYAIPMIKEELTPSENMALDLNMGIGQNIPAVVVAVATMGATNLASGVAAAAINVAGRIATTTVFAAPVWGNTYNDMVQSGYSNAEAVRKANFITLSEVGLEMVFDKLGAIGGTNSVASKLSKHFGELVEYSSKTTMGRIALTQLGAMAARSAGGLVEESTQTLIEPFLHYFSTGEFNWDSNQGRQAAYDGFIGMVTGVLLGGTTDLYRTFVDVKMLSNIGKELSGIKNGTNNIIEQGKSSRYDTTRALAASVENAAKSGKLNNIDLGELTSRVGDEIAANLAIEMGEKSSVFKTDLPAAADYYQSLARGDMDTAKTVLKSTLNQIAASSGYKTTSGKTGLSDGIKSYFEKIRDTLSGMKAENKSAESVESVETIDITDSRTGQDTAVGQTENTANNTSNNTAKADPTTGQAGAKALADIAKTNPGLAVEGVGHTDLVDAYNAGVKGEDIARGTRENAAAGNYSESVEAMYNAGQADAATINKETLPEPNSDFEAELAPFELSIEERAAAEEYARTGKDSAFSNKFDRDSVSRIMEAAEIIKAQNGKNNVDTQQGEGYNGNNDVGDTSASIKPEDIITKLGIESGKGGKYSAESISQEFGHKISQKHVDAHQDVYQRYFDLKDKGLSRSEINDQLLDDMLQKSVNNPETEFNQDDALDVKKSIAEAYQRAAELDAIDRDTFYDIKNGLIPYDPQTQFPNAYKIYQSKFTGKTDLGVIISQIKKTLLVNTFNAFGRKGEDGKAPALFTLSYNDAAYICKQAKTKAEFAKILSLPSNTFNSGVWLGQIDASLIANMRFSSMDELGANEWWAPGMRTSGGQFETVISRLENLNELIANGTIVFKKIID